MASYIERNTPCAVEAPKISPAGEANNALANMLDMTISRLEALEKRLMPCLRLSCPTACDSKPAGGKPLTSNLVAELEQHQEKVRTMVVIIEDIIGRCDL